MHPNASAFWTDYILHQPLGACSISLHVSINAQSAFHVLQATAPHPSRSLCTWILHLLQLKSPTSSHKRALIHDQKNKSLKKTQINLNCWKEVKGNKNRTMQHGSDTEELKLKTWFELWMNKTD